MRASQPTTTRDEALGLWCESFGAIGDSIGKLQNGGVTRNHLYRLRTDPQYARAIAQLMVTGQLPDNWFPLEVDYDQPLSKLLAGLDHTGLQPEWFPRPQHGQVPVTIQLIELPVSGGEIKSRDALLRLEMWDLRPINLYELGTLAQKYPEVERANLIAALGAAHQLDPETVEYAVLRRDDLNQLGRMVYPHALKFATNTTLFGAVGVTTESRPRRQRSRQ